MCQWVSEYPWLVSEQGILLTFTHENNQDSHRAATGEDYPRLPRIPYQYEQTQPPQTAVRALFVVDRSTERMVDGESCATLAVTVTHHSDQWRIHIIHRACFGVGNEFDEAYP